MNTIPLPGTPCVIINSSTGKTKTVICTSVGIERFSYIEGSEDKLHQAFINQIVGLIEGPAAIKAYRQIMKKKGSKT
jgi:hypothetical protein